ncbi:hypothetical protein [Caldovatus aquaticus]|uniref:Peptide chain release factor 1 n=1 Tax=Caldovatus aquaticus TaxID=2865671 RepID=A0ABS7EYR5_9PROT|nr:hypothetical protein [Caldovatus aquaticus]MBW8268439.1 hypothetical protein [Caldovatus aquaticus]
MTDLEFESKLAELDRLLNDPDVQLDPHRIWALLAELSAHELRLRPMAASAPRPALARAAAQGLAQR